MSIYVDIEKLKNSGKFTIDDDHDWGYQIRMVNEPPAKRNKSGYCAKYIVLENDEKGSQHFHGRKTETFTVLSGEVMIYMDFDGELLKEGDSITLIPGERHQMQAWKFPAIVLETSTHDEDSDTYIIEEE